MEYVIWGKVNGEADEQLLLTRIKGKPITSIAVARTALKLIEAKLDGRDCRIQEIDGTPPDFTKAINL